MKRIRTASLILVSLMTFESHAQWQCLGLYEPNDVLARSQPRTISFMGQTVLAHNTLLAQMIFSAGEAPSKKSLISIVEQLKKHKTLELPLTKDGFLTAASNGEHHGGYGSYVWLRDLARAYKGISSLPQLFSRSNNDSEKARADVTKMGHAMLQLFSEKEQVVRTLKNIINPRLHLDPANGFRNVIFVRLGLAGRENGQTLTPELIEKESIWGHKQNDAVALYAHAILDGLANKQIKISELTIRQRAELIYLISYFQRIGFQRMQDVGAWEETMGLRTSSYGLVLKFLERFNDGWAQAPHVPAAERDVFRQLRKDWDSGAIYKELSSFMKENKEELSADAGWTMNIIGQSIANLPKTINESYRLLFSRLGILAGPNGHTIYSPVRELHEGRTADAAILHLLLYPPKRLTVHDRVHIINDLKKNLMRESGFIRYNEDWFLYGGPNAVESAHRLPLDPDTISVRDGDGYRPSTRHDRDQIYQDYQAQKYDKNMQTIINKNGSGLEAQWAFQDAQLTQIYVQLYKETQDPEMIKSAWFHLARALSLITGENQINIEGHKIEAWRALEAWTVVRTTTKNETRRLYFASPNSPLNWTIAEIATGLNDILSVVK